MAFFCPHWGLNQLSTIPNAARISMTPTPAPSIFTTNTQKVRYLHYSIDPLPQQPTRYSDAITELLQRLNNYEELTRSPR